MKYHNLEQLIHMDSAVLKKYLAIPDLSDPLQGINPLNLIIDRIKTVFVGAGYPAVETKRNENRISSTKHEFDDLSIPLDSSQRSPKYVCYINETHLLRSHLTPMLVPTLKRVVEKQLLDSVYFFPGICYLRNILDKNKTGQPHKMDIWRIKKTPLGNQHELLNDLIGVLIKAVAPQRKYRIVPAQHAYTDYGVAIEVERAPNSWMKLAEGGCASKGLLRNNGLDPKEYCAVGVGLGLERCAMLVKGIDDIRVFRAKNPKIIEQMKDLSLYKPIIMHQPITCDVYIEVDDMITLQDLCECIREALGDDRVDVQEVKIINESFNEHKKNLVFRISFNSLEKMLTQTHVDSLVSVIKNSVYKR